MCFSKINSEQKCCQINNAASVDTWQVLLLSHLSELKLEAVTMTSSLFWTNTGIFLQPGDFNNLCSNFSVSADKHTHTIQCMSDPPKRSISCQKKPQAEADKTCSTRH